MISVEEIIAILSIHLLVMWALYLGYDTAIVSLGVGAISGIVGYEIGKKKKSRDTD